MSDPRDTSHFPCNCVPELGPPHCHLHAIETEWPCADACETCSGHGSIGGLTPYGYDGQDCPDCNTPETETTP